MPENFVILLKAEEVASELRVTVRTVYAWLRSGKLKGAKIGGVWRIRKDW